MLVGPILFYVVTQPAYILTVMQRQRYVWSDCLYNHLPDLHSFFIGAESCVMLYYRGRVPDLLAVN
jgi:hypothetical protein